MANEKTACTGLKCPLKCYCEHFRNHELKNTKSYFMADFDSEKGMCKNFKYLENENNKKQIIIKINGKKTTI